MFLPPPISYPALHPPLNNPVSTGVPVPASFHSPTYHPPLSNGTTPSTHRQPPLVPTQSLGEPMPYATPPLDRFAKAFIPRWLLNVSENPMITQIALPTKPRRMSIDEAKTYIDTLLPRPFLIALESENKDNHLRIQDEVMKLFVQNGISWSAFLSQSDQFSNPSHTHKLPTLPPLSAGTYAVRLLPLIACEHSARIAQLKSAQLYLVDVNLIDHSKGLFNLEAKSVREGWPPIELGDLIGLRRLYPKYLQSDGLEYEGRVCAIKRVDGFITFECPQLAAVLRPDEISIACNVLYKPQDRNFYAMHYACEKLDGALRRPALWPLANLSPSPSAKTTTASATSEPQCVNNVSGWLFPDPIHLLKTERKLIESGTDGELRWLDPDLNLEQKRAIRSFVLFNRLAPLLISGPPGTGKTKTITEAVFQILITDPDSHIIVCGASNPSADTLAMRLKTRLNPSELFRLNDCSRPFEEIKPQLLAYCHLQDGHFGLPPLPQLLSKRVIVTSCIDASLLELAYCSNAALQRFHRFVDSSLHPHTSKPLSGLPNAPALARTPIKPHFTHCLIDEAAQATEPELAIPISVILSDLKTSELSELPQILICGDMKQLGPNVISGLTRTFDLDVSLLQRLLEREAYSAKPLPRSRARPLFLRPKDGWTYPTYGHLSPVDSAEHHRQFTRFPIKVPLTPESPHSLEDCEDTRDDCDHVVHLSSNYRSHPTLLMLPSTLFYNDTLEPCAPPQILNTELVNWARLPHKGTPIIFKSVQCTEDWVDEGSSWFNPGECETVVGFVIELISQSESYGVLSLGPDPRPKDYASVPRADGSGGSGSRQKLFKLKPSEISVITPFREQVWVIRLALRKVGLGEVDVGNVEALQGAENRVVILSTVRSHHTKHIEDDRRRDRGLIFEAQRFNVAMTRAKELMIVVGNASTLTVDPHWRSFYHFTRRMGAYEGEPVEGLEDSVADVSVLEERFHHHQRRVGADASRRSPITTRGVNEKGNEVGVDPARILAGSVVRSALEEEA
ncbi:hypothetical protein CROQUDRAFT_649720, partial [Cronartium quercuum f. sp. fusiforme G11]